MEMHKHPVSSINGSVPTDAGVYTDTNCPRLPYPGGQAAISVDAAYGIVQLII